ncbi:MAG: hydroxypyruvate isomerase [Solibacterales bacterium]|nr:hydroxypyruvate isomerase [Bryobacterales bacterium]|tara:strand:+ start:2724 stop:3599 length:876 start_codon:yes stop_codon:yes gene_type:complete
MWKTSSTIKRRSVITGIGVAALNVANAKENQKKTVSKGRLKQSVCRWCYDKPFVEMSLDELARNASAIGLKSVELLTEDEWPVVKKYGLTCAVGSGINGISNGLNDVTNHAAMEKNFRRLLPLAKKHGVANLICFSGNRHNISDERAWDNSTLLLNKVKTQAEDEGVTILLELLNSKIDHPDYHCDKTSWGVEIMKRVKSSRVKLLYDIYHMQIMEGDVIRTIRNNIEYIGHFHTGGNPGRNEIDETQELNYRAICKSIVELGFDGYLAQEFIPIRDPVASLRKAAAICDV